MALIYITGTSGAGKSTVREELSRRGARAYDTDEDEIAQWVNKVTGEITPLIADAHRTPAFLAQNDWTADPERVRKLAKERETRTVFLCGFIGNEDEVWSFFERVFLLSIDEATMRHRLLTRSAHDFGKRTHELELLLAWNEVVNEHYLHRGAIVIDATKPPPFVADEILRALQTAS
jgi:broad-specificity NMP kinase